MTKNKPLIEIYEVYDSTKTKDLIFELEVPMSKYSQKELIKKALYTRIDKYSDLFYIKEWEILYKNDKEQKKVIYKKEKLLKEDYIEKDNYYVLVFNYTFSKKKPKIFEEILFEEKNINNLKSINSLKKLREINYSPTYDRVQLKKLRVKAFSYSLILNKYKDNTYTQNNLINKELIDKLY